MKFPAQKRFKEIQQWAMAFDPVDGTYHVMTVDGATSALQMITSSENGVTTEGYVASSGHVETKNSIYHLSEGGENVDAILRRLMFLRTKPNANEAVSRLILLAEDRDMASFKGKHFYGADLGVETSFARMNPGTGRVVVAGRDACQGARHSSPVALLCSDGVITSEHGRGYVFSEGFGEGGRCLPAEALCSSSGYTQDVTALLLGMGAEDSVEPESEIAAENDASLPVGADKPGDPAA